MWAIVRFLARRSSQYLATLTIIIAQLPHAAQHTAKPMQQTSLTEYQHITLSSSIADAPSMPPPTDENTFTQAPRVVALFELIQAGKHINEHPWAEFQLAPGEYDEIERRLERDELLWGYVKDKIQYDYDARRHLLFVRMRRAVNELFIARVENAIRSQLKLIGGGSGSAAIFAMKVCPARSSEIYFPVDDAPPSIKSKHDPDASFWHRDAQYPGVIIEVVYSKKQKRLRRLAEDYLLDSDANVRVVVGLNIEHTKGTRKATLSVWRTHVFHTTDGDELRVVEEVADEAFHDDQGNVTDHPGLLLRLSDFACESLAQSGIKDHNRELIVSAQQLCQYLTEAETMVRRLESPREHSLTKHSLAPEIKKRKRSKTPPENITSRNEARYIDQGESGQ